MARITTDKAALAVGGSFELVLIGAHRARELSNGALPKIKSDNNSIVTAIREIELGLYTREDFLKSKGNKK
jgi:DNA-directed RNA polymerase omega subunit